MNSHSAIWLAVAAATAIVPDIKSGTFTQFALIVAAAYVAHSQIQRLSVVRRAKRVTKAAKAIRKAL